MATPVDDALTSDDPEHLRAALEVGEFIRRGRGILGRAARHQEAGQARGERQAHDSHQEA